MLTNCWIKHDLQRPNISSSFLDVSSPHLFGMSRVLRVPRSESGWKHKESGDFSVAVSAGSNHRINHDWFRFSGVFSWAARVGRETGSVWSGEAAGLVAGRGGCLLLSVCVLWTFAPLCYIYVLMDSVNPSLTCKADLYWEGTLCCWLMLGDTFTAATVNSARSSVTKLSFVILIWISWQQRGAITGEVRSGQTDVSSVVFPNPNLIFPNLKNST